MSKLTSNDNELIELAKKTIQKLYSEKKHHLATAIRMKSGKMISGINLEGSAGCNDICAEQITLGIVLSQGLKDIETVVTVRHPRPDESERNIKVVSPCGKCRELLIDFAPESHVIICDKDGGLNKEKVANLLPGRYTK